MYKKISITAADETDTLGRDGFNIHGGDDPGSAGCIDLTKYNDTFMQIFRATKKDLKLKVQY
ncbi:MAG: hypothetical protein R3Y46_02785 [Opitutales bacterium]